MGRETHISQELASLKAKALTKSVHIHAQSVQVIHVMKWQWCSIKDNEALWFSGKNTKKMGFRSWVCLLYLLFVFFNLCSLEEITFLT